MSVISFRKIAAICTALPTDYANLVSDAINQPIQGNDWYSVRDSAYDAIDLGINDTNAQIEAQLQ